MSAPPRLVMGSEMERGSGRDSAAGPGWGLEMVREKEREKEKEKEKALGLGLAPELELALAPELGSVSELEMAGLKYSAFH